jgi:hypothetical protein
MRTATPSPPLLLEDLLGQVLSSLCVAHCLLLPLLLGLLPAAGWLEEEWVHGGLLVLALGCAAPALVRGHARHRSRGVLAAGAAGAAGLVLGMLAPEGAEALETGATVAGGVLLAGTHARNRALTRACCARGAAES